MDRRRFIKTTAGLTASFPFLLQAEKSPFKPVRVSLVRDPSSISDGEVNTARVKTLLDRLIRVQYDVADPLDVFSEFFSPRDRVGIKVNCLSGRRMSTHPPLVDAIVNNLLRAGVPGKNILIWERLTEDLRQGGFTIRPPGEPIACAGCDVLGYADELTVYRSIGSLFSRAVTDFCTAQINVPVLKDHGIVGVTLGMKNMFGAIHNPNKYHLERGDPAVADLYSHPDIGGKIRMTILDALEAQCEGGPPYQPNWCEDFGGLLTSNDPVALDRVGWKIIEDLRSKRGQPSLKEAEREPTYIHTAAVLGLGTDQLNDIEIREV
jgi:uncharacterized protein (DUF362 family)